MKGRGRKGSEVMWMGRRIGWGADVEESAMHELDELEMAESVHGGMGCMKWNKSWMELDARKMESRRSKELNNFKL